MHYLPVSAVTYLLPGVMNQNIKEQEPCDLVCATRQKIY